MFKRFIFILLFVAGCETTLPVGLYQTETIKNVVYKHVDNKPLSMDIVIPSNGNELNGCVLWFHGGAWIFGSKEDSLSFVEFVSSFGYVGISVDYRLLTNGVNGWDIVRDADDALQFVRDHGSGYGIDVNRICVGGDSAGGYLALMVGLRHKAKSIIAIYSPTELISLEQSSLLTSAIVSSFVGNINNVVLMEELSPITYLNASSPSILLIHGTDDYVVPFSQSERFYERALSFGVDIKFVDIEDVGHGWTIFPYSHGAMRTYPLIIDQLSLVER